MDALRAERFGWLYWLADLWEEEFVKRDYDSDKIQMALYHDCVIKTHKVIAPNVFTYDWEGDMVSVTRAAFVNEFEIKISQSDFRLDSKKYRKHDILKTGSGWADEVYKMDPNQRKKYPREERPRPNFFWYVAPDRVIPPREVPNHAGLMIIEGRKRLRIAKKAPSLHRDKIAQPTLIRILKSFQYKYWNLRLGK